MIYLNCWLCIKTRKIFKKSLSLFFEFSALAVNLKECYLGFKLLVYLIKFNLLFNIDFYYWRKNSN